MQKENFVYGISKPVMFITGLLTLFLSLHQWTDAQTSNDPYEIVLTHTNEQQTKYSIELRGLPEEVLTQLASLSLSAKEWNEILAVYAGDSPQPNLPAMLGKYEVNDDCIIFHPQFSLNEGKTYTAVFNPDVVIKKYPSAQLRIDQVQQFIHIPNQVKHELTTVVEVYPTSDVLPENLLRMYIYFSQPMSKGGVYQYLQLLDENGKEVELPFLELDEELWDPEQKRFTLLFDPGRIKKELKPNLDTGLPLVAGHSYTFIVKKEWKDANGNFLLKDYSKEFKVISSDTKTPEPKNWKITLPKKDSQDQLIIQFDEPLNHAMAERLIVIKDHEKNDLDGSVMICEHETEFQFVPAYRWTSGKYWIFIDPSIEDRAGNSIMRAFDRDMKNATQAHYTETVIIPISVQ